MQLDFEGAERAGVGLGVAERAALVALVIGGRKPDDATIGQRLWVPQSSLPTTHAVGLATLIAFDLVVVWEHDAHGHPLEHGPYLTLTAWGAFILGVEPVEQTDSYPRWAEAEDPDAAVSRWGGIRLPPSTKEYGMRSPELVADKAPGPEYLTDDWSDEPVELWGVPVPIDRRVRGKKGRRGKRRAG